MKTELNLWFFGETGLIAMGIALVTVNQWSRLAARRNTAEVLKYE